MFFYQYVQSFSPKENITPQKAHEIGLRFAEYFKGHEVLVATHTDAEHIHTHLIINSVNFQNGKKLQMARGSIHKLRKFSDNICREYELSVIQPKKQGLKNMHSREYRAALKGESWKFKLINAVDSAMEHSRSKAEFIRQMQKLGYSVKWQDSRKHITYTTPEGKKCRDNKMHDVKYLKENMEVFYEHRTLEGFEQAGKPHRAVSNTTADVRNPHRNAGAAFDNAVGHRARTGSNAGKHSAVTDMEGHSGNTVPDTGAEWGRLLPHSFGKRKIPKRGDKESVRGFKIDSEENNFRGIEGHGKKSYGKGFNAPENPSEMDGVGSVSADDIFRIAVDIENLIEPDTPALEREKKRQERKQKKQSQKPRDHGQGMEI